MSTEIACRAPVQLLLIECTRRPDGFYHHVAYEGGRRVVEIGTDHTLSAEHADEMRRCPIMFVSWCDASWKPS